MPIIFGFVLRVRQPDGPISSFRTSLIMRVPSARPSKEFTTVLAGYLLDFEVHVLDVPFQRLSAHTARSTEYPVTDVTLGLRYR